MAKDTVNVVESEAQLLSIINDDFKLAQALFKWVPRSWQETVLRCNERKIVLRVGRRGGKTELLVIKALLKAFRKRNQCIWFLTPAETHIEEIFYTVKRRFLSASPQYSASIVRMTSRPYRIELSNGSFIGFMTAGTKSGGNAMGIRGKRADLVILDEADFLGIGDVDAILAILMESKEVQIMASSTPSGRDGYYKNWCLNKGLGWKEFHYTSRQANPNYDDEMDREMRANYPGYAYEREVLAEFSEEATAWFPRIKVEEAAERWERNFSAAFYPTFGYMLKDHSITPTVRTMGVDWDKMQAGPQIVILEKDGEYYKVINRTIVPRQEYSLGIAVREIIRLNAEFNPQWIYVDQGMGERQVEELHQYGEKHPETNLKRKVKKIHFNSTVSMTDPATKGTSKEQVKAVMANQLLLLFERDLMILNKNDTIMLDQLLSYNVVRVTTAGLPVFTSVNEHTVDALMLAAFAMLREVVGFNKVVFTKKVSITGPLGSMYDKMRKQHGKSLGEDEPLPDGAVREEDRKSFASWCPRGGRYKIVRRDLFRGP